MTYKNSHAILTLSSRVGGPALRGSGDEATKMNEQDPMNAAQLRKINAEIQKIRRESDKLLVETRWYPMVVSSALIATIITLTKLFL